MLKSKAVNTSKMTEIIKQGKELLTYYPNTGMISLETKHETKKKTINNFHEKWRN